MAIIEALTLEEQYLHVLLQDPSGIDQCEFAMTSEEHEDGCWRAWDFQYSFWRSRDQYTIVRGARSVGKSMSCCARAIAFPFVYPGNEMLITAPEKIHLDALTNKIETEFGKARLFRSMLKGGERAFTHQPFMGNFLNGARILGRIPQRDGRGVKGSVSPETLILTEAGYRPASDVKEGDKIWTLDGWMPVLAKSEYDAERFEIRGQGSFPITASWNHRFYGSHNEAKNPAKQKRVFTTPDWCGVEELQDQHFYWGSPMRFDPLSIPSLKKTNEHCVLPDMESSSFWWIVGRYMADGYLSDEKGTRYRVHICAHPKDQAIILKSIEGLGKRCSIRKRDHSTADILEFSSTPMGVWLEAHVGRSSYTKIVPGWMLGMKKEHRQAVLDGYLSGDGSDLRLQPEGRKADAVGSASKALTLGMQMLAQSLGRVGSSHSVVQPNVTEICGVKLKKKPALSYRCKLNDPGYGHAVVDLDGMAIGKVRSVAPASYGPVVNLVTESHSYLSEGIISHNSHPLVLIQDESSDYPNSGWVELTETLKHTEGSRWLSFGVTRGIRDQFYKFTQPGSGWTVYNPTAIHRPNWTDKERQQKILQYGSEDDPDYRRNILGAHGDATSPLFPLNRLMAIVDDQEDSEYNTDVYVHDTISGEQVDAAGGIENLINFNSMHKTKTYKSFWAGVDIGWTTSPTEILVFGETERTKGKKRLELLYRLSLRRTSGPDQSRAMSLVIEHYGISRLGMDSTGAGLPVYQIMKEDATASKVVGYNFKEKILVDIDQTIDVDPAVDNILERAGIKRQVLLYSTDLLRLYVDEKRILLPWDRNLIGQFQATAIENMKAGTDEYGRRRISSSAEDHALDAARMAVLAHGQYQFDQMVEGLRTKTAEPVLDMVGW